MWQVIPTVHCAFCELRLYHPQEVVTAIVDLEEVRSYRFAPSRGVQAVQNTPYQRIEAEISLSAEGSTIDLSIKPTKEINVRFHTAEEEIALGPACWLWDYLRRCGGISGFFLPLSGGIDSCATATIVHSMCRLVVEACEIGGKVFTYASNLSAATDEEYWVQRSKLSKMFARLLENLRAPAGCQKHPRNSRTASFTLLLWALRTLARKLGSEPKTLLKLSARTTLI